MKRTSRSTGLEILALSRQCKEKYSYKNQGNSLQQCASQPDASSFVLTKDERQSIVYLFVITDTYQSTHTLHQCSLQIHRSLHPLNHSRPKLSNILGSTAICKHVNLAGYHEVSRSSDDSRITSSEKFTSAHPTLCMNSTGDSNSIDDLCVRTRSCSCAPGDCWTKPALAADIGESRAVRSSEDTIHGFVGR